MPVYGEWKYCASPQKPGNESQVGVSSKLFLSPKTVETHVNSIFNKLRLAQAPDDHRRVLAVLAYLRAERRVDGPEA